MPETVTEYAVRGEYGEIIPRPSRVAAQATADGITSRGGTAILVTRQVTCAEWAEPEPEEEREFDLGPAPDYKCFIEDHAACQEHGYACTCGCHTKEMTS